MDFPPSTPTASEPANYHSFLLRLWRDGPQRPWRASMHSTTTGTQHYFANLMHLHAFLQAHTEGGREFHREDPEGER
jgi:hypothetical protein